LSLHVCEAEFGQLPGMVAGGPQVGDRLTTAGPPHPRRFTDSCPSAVARMSDRAAVSDFVNGMAPIPLSILGL
jgi:hypothetical protein